MISVDNKKREETSPRNDRDNSGKYRVGDGSFRKSETASGEPPVYRKTK